LSPLLINGNSRGGLNLPYCPLFPNLKYKNISTANVIKVTILAIIIIGSLRAIPINQPKTNAGGKLK